MKYYVYKCYIEVTYGYSNGAHYFESWTKVAEADSIKDAMRFATEHAEADPLTGDRESYDGKAVVGLYPARGQSRVDAYAKAAKVRAEVIFNEHQKMQKQIDELNERVRNQEIIIKTEGKSLTEQRTQLNDLGASLRDIKEVVDDKLDDLMKTHGDDIIPMF